MAHALAGGWLSLAFLRGLMGLTEASAIPAGMKASAEWFPAKERGIAGGLFNAGTSVGANAGNIHWLSGHCSLSRILVWEPKWRS